jgi:hypothetical protein
VEQKRGVVKALALAVSGPVSVEAALLAAGRKKR